MATHLHDQDDPILSEGRRLLEEDPQLSADLGEFGRRLDAGELVEGRDLHATAEVRRRLGLSASASASPAAE